MVLLAQRVAEIGGRIPMTLGGLGRGGGIGVFTGRRQANAGDDGGRGRHGGGGRGRGVGRAGEFAAPPWSANLWRAAGWMLPLALVSLLEVRRLGHDPIVWLMNGALVLALCSAPYFRLVSGTVVGGVVLSMCTLMLLWLPAVHWMLGEVARLRSEGVGVDADTFALHCFFAPEFRHLFYGFSAAVLLVYCPIMLGLGRWRYYRGVRRLA